MALLGLLIGMVIVFGGLGILCMVRAVTDPDSYDTGGWIAGAIIFLAIGLCPLSALIGQYQSSLALEERIPALIITISEQTALLAQEPTLGTGLEGLEIKREIQSNIKEKNELIAAGKVRIRSAWWYYKPIPAWEEK